MSLTHGLIDENDIFKAGVLLKLPGPCVHILVSDAEPPGHGHLLSSAHTLQQVVGLAARALGNADEAKLPRP
eukprot:11176210-Lingulodinium_polyedra.AAC.2